MTGHALKSPHLESGLWWPVCECGTSGPAQEFLTLALLWHEDHLNLMSRSAPDANSRQTVAVKP